MARTFTRFVERINQQLVLRTEPGRKFIGLIGALSDITQEACEQALRAGWVGDNVGPAVDALSAAGDEVSLPKYPRESSSQYRARLARVWEDWPTAGHESSILAQLDAAGFSDAQIYDAGDWPLSGLAAWWSQFWVYFPAGTHTVTAAGPVVGSFTVGDGSSVGVVGLTLEDLAAMRAIVNKFKPAHYICSGIIFELSGWTVGTGHDVGDPGLLVGGSVATVGAI